MVPSVYELDATQLAAHLDGEPRYRADQVFQGLWAQALDVGVRELIRKEDSVEKLCDLVSLCAVAMRTS